MDTLETIKKEKLASLEAIFVDLDDTLLTKDKKLSPRVVKALHELPIPFFFDTGRNDAGIENAVHSLFPNNLRLSLNGNVLVRNHCLVKISGFLPKREAIEAVTLLEENFTPEELACIPYDPLHWYCKNLISPFPESEHKASGTEPLLYGTPSELNKLAIIKILLSGTPEACKKALKILEPYQDKMDIVQNHIDQVELNPLGISKGTGIKEVCRIYSFDPNNCLAMGDSALDLSMFKEAGLKAAVANGEEQVKKQADLLVPSAEEEGPAKLFELIKKAKEK